MMMDDDEDSRILMMTRGLATTMTMPMMKSMVMMVMSTVVSWAWRR